MITTEVAFARSTWRKSKEFSAGLHDLAQRMPMELVRLYVTEGVRTPRVRIDYYDRIDELRALRREAAMNTARKNLDWDGMRAAALDPELLDARREPHKCEEECAMCGNFCAVKMLREL